MSNYNTSFNYPASGLNNTAEYIASGLPWATASVVTTSSFNVTFPFVTNELVITNSGSLPLRVGFTSNGVNGSNYLTVLAGQTTRLDVRLTKLYLRADTSGSVTFSMFAGLTQIPARSMPVLTASYASYNPNVTGSYYGYATGIG